MNFFSDLVSVYIIAEIGVNHNGDVGLAKKLIDIARESGADAVKFQTFTASKLASIDTPKAAYQLLSTPEHQSHFEMLRQLELSQQAHLELLTYCRESKIEFLSTPYDTDSVKFLASIGVRFFKTASADLVDLQLQQCIASFGKPTIIATGMSNLGEIERTVDIYRQADNMNIALLHCVSNYPCSDQSLNLLSMDILSTAFSVPIGFSDHSEGSLASVVAVARGAKVIEKHITLDKNLPGPDHRASSSPTEFSDLVNSIRRAEKMLGKKIKTCQPEESQMAIVSRKSIFLARPVKKGEIFSKSDFDLFRPGDGIGSEFLPNLIGRSARENFNVGHKLRWGDVEN